MYLLLDVLLDFDTNSNLLDKIEQRNETVKDY